MKKPSFQIYVRPGWRQIGLLKGHSAGGWWVVIQAKRLPVEVDGVLKKFRSGDGLSRVAAVAGVTHETGYFGRIVVGLNIIMDFDLFCPGFDGLGEYRALESHMVGDTGTNVLDVHLHHLSVPLKLCHLSKK